MCSGGTPLYVQVLVLYSGVYSLAFVQSQPLLNGFFREGINCAILAFAICSCAYTTEIFAGAILAVPPGEVEAARAYGMSTFGVYRRIVLPDALRRALPAYGNEVILVLHATSIAFTATVPDILKIARDVNSATYAPFSAFGIAALIYAAIAFTLVWQFRRIEARLLAFQRPHPAGATA